MANLTFSNQSNAVRGFRQHFPDIAAAHDNSLIRMDFLNDTAINLEAVADYQADRMGVVSGSTLSGVPALRRSVAKGSVSQAHALFAKLPAGTSRKDAIAAAVAQGIAYFTARTQYQAWSKGA